VRVFCVCARVPMHSLSPHTLLFFRLHCAFTQECARRAALAARAIIYGESTVYMGPEPRHVTVTAAPYARGMYYVLDIAFDLHGSQGLQHPTVPVSLLSFEVLLALPNTTTSQARGQGGYWVPATIHPPSECSDGGKASVRIGVTAFYDPRAEPTALRYAHGDFPTGILHNVEGLPVAPFLIAVNHSVAE
jgi:hypothetical protein